MLRQALRAIRRITPRVNRRSGVLRTAAASVLAVGLMSGTAAAQAPPEFAVGGMEVGRKVAITDEQGGMITGRITQLAGDVVTVGRKGDSRDFPYKEIVRIDAIDDLKNGTLIGLLVGAAIFAVDASLAHAQGVELTAAGFAVFGGIYAGAGAALGAGIDALVGGNKTIYRRGGGAHMTVSPTVHPHRAGVRLAFSW